MQDRSKRFASMKISIWCPHIATVTKYDLLLLLLDHKLNKQMWPPTQIGHSHAPFGILREILFFGKTVLQYTPPLKGCFNFLVHWIYTTFKMTWETNLEV